MLTQNLQCEATYFHELKSIMNGEIIQYTQKRIIDSILLDSRLKGATAATLFFAIPGSNHDGHAYITTAYQQGVRQFVVMVGQQAHYQYLDEANIIKVTHTITALQALVTHHRKKFILPVLAITGSNGKTIIKEWLSKTLSLQYNVVSNPKSYNSQVGVPLAVSLINKTHEYAIFEAGISLPYEMEKLERIIQPQIGIFTNIGSAHDQGFSSQQQKIEEKAKLFTHCKKIYYCADHTAIDQVITRLYKREAILITWSFYNPEVPYYIQTTKSPQSNQISLCINHQHKKYLFNVSLQQEHFLENIIHCIVFLLNEEVKLTLIQNTIATLDTIPMRLTLKEGINNCQIIDDTYHNDLVGLRVALDFLSQQQHGTQTTVILADLLQTGISPQKLYQQLGQLLKQKNIDHLIGIGEEISKHPTAFTTLRTTFYQRTDDFLQSDLHAAFHNETILIKGARDFKLERVVIALQQNTHQTSLEVNLDAIRHNLGFFRSKLNKGTKLMVMVKASAYGSSNFELAHLLQHQHVDYLAVAYTDEGVLLKTHGIHLPIMVMHATFDDFYKLIDYQLEPVIYSLPILDRLIDFLVEQKKSLYIHIKLETGMYRLGIEETELNTLINRLYQCSYITVKSIYSHLAASESAFHDDYTRTQGAIFIKMAHRIEQALKSTMIKHLVNTNGILRFPEFQYDMVRLGIGLYGVGTDQKIIEQLEIASTLKTVISQVKKVPKGSTIGYGRQGRATYDMEVATIPIGYADGFKRLLGNGVGKVIVNGKKVPTIGNICMDMSTIDVTGMGVKVGNEVIIFGKSLPIEELAYATNTIPYEILTGINSRVRRIYYIG